MNELNFTIYAELAFHFLMIWVGTSKVKIKMVSNL